MSAKNVKKKKTQGPMMVGRESERDLILACLRTHKNVLLEGPVGVGKTHLALSAIAQLKLPVFRVDGDSRYTEQKLAGWFDPPAVMKKGYGKASFIAGPLVEAMQSGGVLFINELNRLPEGVQNILLPAIDERLIVVPRLGEIRAAPGFVVIATQNPKEFVATSHLSEAILDRFELIVLDYQSEPEEVSIVESRVRGDLVLPSVRLARLTRHHPKIKRGASVRAAISVAELATALSKAGASLQDAFLQAALLALPTRIEIEHETENESDAREETRALISQLVQSAQAGHVGESPVKKNF